MYIYIERERDLSLSLSLYIYIYIYPSLASALGVQPPSPIRSRSVKAQRRTDAW